MKNYYSQHLQYHDQTSWATEGRVHPNYDSSRRSYAPSFVRPTMLIRWKHKGEPMSGGCFGVLLKFEVTEWHIILNK
jgi:hypothetical protein